MDSLTAIEAALSGITSHIDTQIIADVASLLVQWGEGQVTRDVVRTQLQERRFAPFLRDVAGQSLDTSDIHLRFGRGQVFRTIIITVKGRSTLRLRVPLQIQKISSAAHAIQRLEARWDRIIGHPLLFFSLRVWGIIVSIVTVVGGVVGIGVGMPAFVSHVNDLSLRCGFSRESDDETLIIITMFEQAEQVRGTDPHDAIRNQLVAEAANLDMSNVRVHICDVNIDTSTLDSGKERAERLGNNHDASIVVWGKYTAANVTTHFLNRKQPSATTAFVTINETEQVELVDPDSYALFVTDGLPSHVSFLSLFTLADAMSNQEHFTEALQIIKRAISLSENFDISSEALSSAYFRLGWLYFFSEQDTLQAFDAFAKAIELDPSYAAAYSGRGAIYAVQGDYEQALVNYDRAIELDPTDAVTYYNRGIAYANQGKYEQALADYDRAIELNPTDVKAYYNRGVVQVKRGEYEQALADYDRAIELDPTDAEAYYNRGVVQVKRGEHEQALVNYAQAIELDPSYAAAYSGRGAIYAVQGDYEQALADYAQAIELDPSYAVAYYNRGIAYANQGKYEQALADYAQAIELDPTDAVAYHNRAAVYAWQGKYGQALVNYDRAIELDPTDAEAYYNRGTVYTEQGDYEAAVIDFGRVIDLSSDSSLRRSAQRRIDDIERR